MTRIQVAGHVCVDLKPRLSAAGVGAPGELVSVGPMDITVGGAVGNCGRVLAGMGLGVALSGSIGDDELGVFCRQLLQSLPGSEVDLAVVQGTATSYSVVVEPRGVDRSFWHHTGANDAFIGDCPVTATHLLHYGYPSLTPAMCADDGRPIRALFERAHSKGVATSLDLAFVATGSPVRPLDWARLLRAVAPACDVLCPSWDDLASSLGLSEDAAEAAIESWASEALGWGSAIVLVTLGQRGSYLRVASADRLSSLASCGIEASVWLITPAGHRRRSLTTS